MTTKSNLFANPSGKSAMYVLVGKGTKGKSYFIKWLIYNGVEKMNWKYGLVFVRTKFNGDYDYLPDDKVIGGYNEEILKKYVSNIEKMISKDPSKVNESFLVLDDCTGILTNSTPWFINFIACFRHYKINIIIATQYLTGRQAISPIMREQTNFAIMFESRTKRTLEALYENYGGLFESLDTFKDYFLKLTKEPYVAMLYMEHLDEDGNYIGVKAPDKLPNWKLTF